MKVMMTLIIGSHQQQLLAFNNFNMISDRDEDDDEEEHLEHFVPPENSTLGTLNPTEQVIKI